MQASEHELSELRSLDWYCGYHGERINNFLRGNDVSWEPNMLKNDVDKLECYLKKFRTKENLITMRRFPVQHSIKYKVGKEYLEPAFISSSLNLQNRVNNEGDFEPLRKEALMIIKVPQGSNAAYIEEALPEARQRKEFELLIQRNSTLRIIKTQRILSNRLILAELKGDGKRIAA